MFNRQTLGTRLRELRQKHKLSQVDLAEKLNLNRSSIANYEAGRIMPPGDILMQIADAFEVTTDYLLGRDISEEFKRPYYLDGQIIKKERHKRNMTQGQLAELVEVSQRTISKCERESSANPELLDKIAHVFGAVSWSEIKEKYNPQISNSEYNFRPQDTLVNEHKENYTIAAHHDGEDWTEEELEEIERFKEFVRLKRKKK
ncbi:XRE family transcriptional regulator [Bacillus subtilis]|nr:HTH-type transcriptional regulator ImmR [Bacillus subtilis]CAI6302107.1 XRE family transcriptional regulator [Bacillus subtilis]